MINKSERVNTRQKHLQTTWHQIPQWLAKEMTVSLVYTPMKAMTVRAELIRS